MFFSLFEKTVWRVSQRPTCSPIQWKDSEHPVIVLLVFTAVSSFSKLPFLLSVRIVPVERDYNYAPSNHPVLLLKPPPSFGRLPRASACAGGEAPPLFRPVTSQSLSSPRRASRHRPSGPRPRGHGFSLAFSQVELPGPSSLSITSPLLVYPQRPGTKFPRKKQPAE